MNAFLLQFRSGLARGLGFACALLAVGSTILLADSLHIFSSGDLISATKINANFEKIAPVGTILAWHKDWGTTPALPEGWLECDGQTVNDSESVFNGMSTPDLNGQARFLRGGSTSGTLQADELKSHSHQIYWGATNTIGTPVGAGNVARIGSTGDFIQATGGAETRPINMSVVWIIRVK